MFSDEEIIDISLLTIYNLCRNLCKTVKKPVRRNRKEWQML